MHVLAFAALVVGAIVNVATAFDGFDSGGWNTRSFDIGTKANPVDSLAPYHIRVNYPTTCATTCGEFRTGGMPVVLFVTGFAGQLDAFNYDQILGGTARHGIIAVAVDREAGFSLTLDYGRLGLQLKKVIGWIKQVAPDQGLLYELRARGFTNEILGGASKIFYAGHLNGAQVALRSIRDEALASETCTDTGGVIMLSPLDGQDPLGFGGDTVIVKEQPFPFATPGLIVAAELDRVSGSILSGVSCAPDDRANKHFYEAWVGAINFVEVDDVGTLDVMNGGARTTYDEYCARSNATTTYKSNYRIYVRGVIVNFINGIVLTDQDYIEKISRPRPNTVRIAEAEDKGVGRSLSCSYVPVAQTMPFELQTGLILFGFLFALTFITGLYCFFRRMDDDTLHRYHPAEGMGMDQPASFQTKLDPGYSASVANEYQSQNFAAGNSRAPSINV